MAFASGTYAEIRGHLFTTFGSFADRPSCHEESAMSVRKDDAKILMRDIARLASEGNDKHLAILTSNRQATVKISVLLLAVNTLLTSALWSSLTRDAPVPWVKYSGLALSVIATFASGLMLALDKKRQSEVSLEATKAYGGVVFEATKFRLMVESSGLSDGEERELLRIFKLYNDAATKYGDTLAQLQTTSVWSNPG
jgi:hypothetical protein